MFQQCIALPTESEQISFRFQIVSSEVWEHGIRSDAWACQMQELGLATAWDGNSLANELACTKQNSLQHGPGQQRSIHPSASIRHQQDLLHREHMRVHQLQHQGQWQAAFIAHSLRAAATARQLAVAHQHARQQAQEGAFDVTGALDCLHLDPSSTLLVSRVALDSQHDVAAHMQLQNSAPQRTPQLASTQHATACALEQQRMPAQLTMAQAPDRKADGRRSDADASRLALDMAATRLSHLDSLFQPIDTGAQLGQSAIEERTEVDSSGFRATPMPSSHRPIQYTHSLTSSSFPCTECGVTVETASRDDGKCSYGRNRAGRRNTTCCACAFTTQAWSGMHSTGCWQCRHFLAAPPPTHAQVPAGPYELSAAATTSVHEKGTLNGRQGSFLALTQSFEAYALTEGLDGDVLMLSPTP